MPFDVAAGQLTLKIDRSGDTYTVHCHGKLVYGSIERLTSAVCPLIPGSKRIILDFTDLTHMDSLGVGSLVRLYVSAKAAGSCIELINFGPRIRQILGITNLLSVLTNMCEQGVNIRF
jgi:anti-sigma B factor antagonist